MAEPPTKPAPLVDVQSVTVRFRRRRDLGALLGPPPTFRAVAEADLAIAHQEVVGLVGESGSGKTTLGRTVLRLHEPAEGVILFDGADITHLGESRLRPVWRRMALVFQDPLSSFKPRQPSARRWRRRCTLPAHRWTRPRASRRRWRGSPWTCATATRTSFQADSCSEPRWPGR